jgi:23S rRNA (cytidine1920-2'-O)/16S rRNA (cytidine1409-2'-O)-methyltransferase
MRLDQALVEQYHYSRNKSQKMILGGFISVNGTIQRKPAFHLEPGDTIALEEHKSHAWVSRSAGKLEGFLLSLEQEGWTCEIQDKRCLDIGSSTGGFCQILLQYGAKEIDAVDVGTDQLHAILRNNNKIHVYEKTDIRSFFSREPYDVITCDVSFISL